MERPQVVIELSEALARDISAGGVFVPGCTVRLNEECALVVHGRTQEIELVARVVYLDPGTGAGLELVGFSPALREHLASVFEAWLAEPLEATAAEATAAEPSFEATAAEAPFEATAAEPSFEATAAKAPFEATAAEPSFDATAAEPSFEATAAEASSEASAAEPSFEATAGRVADEESRSEAAEEPSRESEHDGAATDVQASLTDEERADETKRERALSLHERLRGLSMSQQIKLAQHGDQQERIMLERYYNKNVWEPLLRNPKLTAPEVSRIARMGTLPRVLLEVIVNNGAWLQVPEVRRALLSNPRLGTDQILRVLRMLPKHELKLASIQTAYPYAVRDAAKRILKEQGGDK